MRRNQPCGEGQVSHRGVGMEDGPKVGRALRRVAATQRPLWVVGEMGRSWIAPGPFAPGKMLGFHSRVS